MGMNWAYGLVIFPIIGLILPVYADEYQTDSDHMQNCEDWYQYYELLTEEEFYKLQTSPLARDCVKLYKHPIWGYEGEDRLDVLINYYRIMKEASVVEGQEVREESKISAQLEQEFLIDKVIKERVTELEDRVSFLEGEVKKKDDVIMEQLRVIMDLANKIMEVIFDNFLASIIRI